MTKIPDNVVAQAVPERVRFLPYRVRCMTVMAGKILDLMCKSDITMSYEEMKAILDIVRFAISKGEEHDALEETHES